MNEVTIEMTTKQKKKYVRRRRTDLALECALRDAAAASERGADPATMNLIQTRLNVLSNQMARERNDRLKKAMAERDALKAENELLLAENSCLKAELASLRPPSPSALSDLDAQAQDMLRRLRNGGGDGIQN